MHEGSLWGLTQGHAHGREVFYHWAIFHYFTVKNSIPTQVLFAKVGKHHLVLWEVGICISDFSVAVVKHRGQCYSRRRNFSLVMVSEDTSHITSGRHRGRNRELRAHIFKYEHKAERMIEKNDKAMNSKSNPRDRLSPASLYHVNLFKQLYWLRPKCPNAWTFFFSFPPEIKIWGDIVWCFLWEFKSLNLSFSFHILFLREVNSLMLHILTKVFKVASVKSPKNFSSLRIGL